MPPGRSSDGVPELRSRIVDSTPTPQGPPSRIAPSDAPNSARTCSAVVGLTAPNRFADGAATPPPNPCSSASATGCAGTRRPTVSNPPVTASIAGAPRFTISVSGPGQNFAASSHAASGISRPHSSMRSASARWTMSGWLRGRPLRSKIFPTASGFDASAPRPYTVSVGNATRSPAFNRWMADWMRSSMRFRGSMMPLAIIAARDHSCHARG